MNKNNFNISSVTFKTVFLLLIIIITACKEAPLPKPQAYLRLDFPEPQYQSLKINNVPFTFKKNILATEIVEKTIKNPTKTYNISIEYPTLKGTIYLTYKNINNSKSNLKAYLKDAQNFTLEHTQVADEITEQTYIDTLRNVYGTFYEVGGNAASPAQFYVTDSTTHFLYGSLYFYAKPNYDSILPAANYIKNDIRTIIESLSWE